MTELKTSAPARKKERSRSKKVLASLAAVTMVGIAGVAGTTAALSDTTTNEANEFDAAYIDLYDNDGPAAGSFMYDVTDQEFAADGSRDTVRCIRISYTGSRPADVSMYTPTGDTAMLNGDHVGLKVEVGTLPAATAFSAADASGCTGFTVGTAGAANDGVLYDDTLRTFATTHVDAASGLKAGPAGVAPTTKWAGGTEAAYRVTVRVNKENKDIPQAESTSGLHTYTWRADTA